MEFFAILCYRSVEPVNCISFTSNDIVPNNKSGKNFLRMLLTGFPSPRLKLAINSCATFGFKVLSGNQWSYIITDFCVDHLFFYLKQLTSILYHFVEKNRTLWLTTFLHLMVLLHMLRLCPHRVKNKSDKTLVLRK